MTLFEAEKKTVIEFVVPAVPVAQPRQRHRVAVFNGHTVAQNYTPTKAPVNAYKAAVQVACAAVYQGAPLDGRLHAEFVFVFPRPQGMRWKKKPMPRAPMIGKPDLDNLIKATTDALNGLAFVDDARLCCTRATKWIASADEQPHVEVRIEEFSEH